MNTSGTVKFSLHFKIIFVSNKSTNMTDASNDSGIIFSHIIDKLDHYYGDHDKFEQWKTQMKKFFNFHKIPVNKQILIATKYFCE